jgi:protocatechuate 3,4-dioxygenase, beta subunit
MNFFDPFDSRRRFLGTMAMGSLLYLRPGVFADELTITPKQTEGPFYPDKLPLDTDNDLLIINEKITPGVGEITHLTGQVFDMKGNPIRNAVVEIWQCDSNGSYLHSGSDNRKKYDTNFQGFGRFLTGSKGEYYFRTIKPVPYPGRSPHIHVKVKKAGKELLTTQCYIKGHEQNLKDGIYRSLRDPKAQAAVSVAFEPMMNSKIGELMAKFDIVLGLTPEG